MKPVCFILLIFLLAALNASAQVAVRNEPRHHNVFENEFIRILDVRLAPGDTTQYHVHATPSVFIMLTQTVTGSQLAGGQPAKSTSVAGSCWYDSLTTPRIHRVWNEDTGWFHPMDIELTGGKPRSNEPLLKDASLALLFDEALARGYKLTLPANGQINIPSSKTGYLLVSLGEATIDLTSNNITEHRFMQSGHYYWIESGKHLAVTNKKQQAVFELLQLR